MEQEHLVKTIDKAAHSQAIDIQRKIERAIKEAMNPHFRPKEAGGEFIGEDVQKILTWYASNISKCDKERMPPPSQELINLCRQQILKTLIDGIPAFERILALSKENSNE